ncbi:MAG TPA: hypothetical protein VGO09_11620 [Flavisolibacter sp.]|nr:hypothetical protein [Flavisolibacter sp.]
MSEDRSRQGQQSRSGSGRDQDDNVELEYIMVEYDVTPEEAREAITVCGCSNRSDIDDYMRSQGRTGKSGRNKNDTDRQST